MTEHPHKIECPSHEQLSAYFDKESKHPEEIEKHLKLCSICRDYMESLSKIEYSLKHTVAKDTGMDEEISKRILARVHASVGEPENCVKHKFFLSPVLWRVAVLLMIGCSVGYLLWEDMQEDNKERLKAKQSLQPSATVSAALTSATNGRAIQVSELEKIHFSPVADNRKHPAGKIPQSINSYVRHVWTQPDNPGQSVTSLLKKNNIPQDSLTKTEKGWQIQCSISKLQAVHFVRSCSDAGYQLLSPDQPQPEENFYTGQGTDVIRYSAEIIPSK